MNQPQNLWISLDLNFFQHGCLYFESALAYHICMIIAVNVFAYSIRFSPLIVQWAKHWFYLEKPLPNETDFFYFFGLAVRFDWIKTDVWLKLGVFRPSSDAVLHMSRIKCKWGRTKDFSHLHSIRLMSSTASELGLNYSSRPKLSLGSAHVKYGVWSGP